MAVGRSHKIVNSIADSCTANNNVNILTLNLYFNSRTLLLKRGQQGGYDGRGEKPGDC